ncbi:MAG: type II toxin-antitoxin system prevent-host-death family antitoxin [Thermodesulfobacteriota bacterium]
MDWKLAEAKNKFSEVVNLALTEGPQRVSRRDDMVIILSAKDYEKLTKKNLTFKKFLMKGPDFEDIDISRDKTSIRSVEL